jgi:hypothetical protein
MAKVVRCDICGEHSLVDFSMRNITLSNGVDSAIVMFDLTKGARAQELCKECSDIKLVELSNAIIKKKKGGG